MNFGLNMGRQMNLVPLKPLIKAYQYGLLNGSMFDQIILNALMFLPLGFLLPIVFPKHFSSFYAVVCISFVLSLATEISQYAGMRSADIDDLIANTLGGLLGYCLFVIVDCVRKKIQKTEEGNCKSRSSLLLSLC